MLPDMNWNLHNIALIERNKFVLSVGDEGAILTYFKGKKLEQRLFSTLDYEEGMQAFIKLLASNPKAPIHIILDIMDQTCVQQSLPAVSGLTINKLVKKRLERDFTPEDVKGALPLGREKTGRKDWIFMFVSAHLAPPFSIWVDFCLEQHNPIAGIYMLPVEAENFQKKLNYVSGTGNKGKARTDWQFLVLHNRVSGFRQVVFHKGRIVFSRLIGSSHTELPGVVAGTIEQEVLNSMEYLRRLSLPENTKMDIFICVSDDIKHSFEIKEIKGNQIFVFTPYEIAQKCGFTRVVQPKDQFGDIIFAANFIERRPVLKLHSLITKRLAALNFINRTVRYVAYGVLPVMFLLASVRFWDIWDIKQDIAQAELRKAQTNQHWEQVQANARNYDENSTVVRDMVTLYKLLSGGAYSPLTTLAAFNSVKGNNVVVKNINWKVMESSARGAASGRSVISMNMSIDYYNQGQSLDNFFVSFDQFIKRLEDKFSDYNIEYSQLPDKVTVGQISRVVPVEIRILGPNK